MNKIHHKILIACRGEIAVRAIRTCKELGIASVAVYSEADKNSLHVKLAEEAICVGPAPSQNSYLNISNIISAAISTGSTAIYPGYGFLAENEKFVEIVEKCGLKFIGPSSSVMQKVGNKAEARKIAQATGIPVVEGSLKELQTVEEALAEGERIGYPILLKAVYGGGGRGITVINSETELKEKWAITQAEARACFGSGELYLEKYLDGVRHVEVQVLADKYFNVIHLGERDCSLQRRKQKIVEEAPSRFVDGALREKLGSSAIAFTQAIEYENAGTVEFIIDKNGNYYFIEMNARIQVEHPVSEMISGIDLVKEQIRIALGNPLPFKQENIRLNGWAIECRINAEDHLNDFRPCPGIIKNIVFPGGFNVRVDTFIYPNYEAPPYYDSLLAKLIVWAPTRIEAIRKMRVALEQFIIGGIKSNIEFHYLLMHNPDYVRGSYDTNFINHFAKLVVEENRGE
ncbi:MAG: acetyl-CoA carboxylase biotin carboxylase subunit [Bacilli bacterium]